MSGNGNGHDHDHGKTPRIGFAGTPAFAAVALHALAGRHPPAVVYTQPDRPAGRGRKTLPSAVKQVALELGCPLEQPSGLKSAAAQRRLADWRLDLLIVAAYGLLLPPAVLALPRLGCINIHASLLPRWRGAAPIQRALLAGDGETGISIMQMDAGLDTGPVYGQRRCPIEPTMTAGELHDRLAALGASTLLAELPAILTGEATPTPQSQLPGEPCYARKLDKTEAWLDWQLPASRLMRQVLAFNPVPAACTELPASAGSPGGRLRVLRAEVRAWPPGVDASAHPPGTVVAEDRDAIQVACADSEQVLALTEIQLPGRKPLTAEKFLNARSLLGQRLGTPH